jgi:hypothetical protein
MQIDLFTVKKDTPVSALEDCLRLLWPIICF